VEAVDVLVRVDRGDDLVLVDLLGQRQLHQDAVDVGSALSFATRASSSASEVVAGSAYLRESRPSSAQPFSFWRRTP